MSTRREATIESLYDVPEHGKAEIVHGELVHMSPTGDSPSYASGEIFASLREYVKRAKTGRAVGDNAGFIVNLPSRKSFSPDAAYYIGPPAGMRFFRGAPIFAVEIRSENDYGSAAERELAAKRSDYFAAGTQVVWDVDLLSQDVVRVYRASEPETPEIFRRGDVVDAEPAVPGWSMLVDDLFL